MSAKRSGSHSFTSMDIEKILGDALYKYSAGVDLEHPDIRIYIEIRDNRFYLFTEKIEGPGGLPLKSEGKLLSLFSGGIDSPVATYMVMKRGSATDLLFCSLAHPVDTVQMLMAAKSFG
ncbi:THUMP domain-containing protein [Acidiplasma cupricumulans]|uniref:THUMP domain-containing protein n=1 Tax=Acidiplasma cupricumulans TaxID=312540 RepID=UPI000784F3BC|nr:THUMP domain-containing protein [Acidiplasma cupricumulans]